MTAFCIVFSVILGLSSGSIQSWSSWGSIPTAQKSIPSGVINNELVYLFFEDGSIYKKLYGDASWTAVTPSTSVEISCDLSKCSSVIDDRYIYILQGKYQQSPELYAFDTSTEEWLDVVPIPTAVGGSCLTSDATNFLYIVSGYDDTDYPNTLPTLQIYDISNQIWCNDTSMPYSSYYPACAYYDESIYLFGGYESSRQDKVQIFDLNTKQWTYSSSVHLITGTIQMQAVVAGDGQIYILGGLTVGSAPSTLVQVYDPQSGDMVNGAAKNLTFGRAAFVAEIVNDQIVVCGGKDGNVPTRLTSCEISVGLSAPASGALLGAAGPAVCGASSDEPSGSSSGAQCCGEFLMFTPFACGILIMFVVW